MNKFGLILFATLGLLACKSKNIDTANLPKDISLKPDNNMSQQHEREELSMMIKDIESRTTGVTCSDISEWRFAPIGAKPCGGPSSYIAYAIHDETEILTKIAQFTQKQAAFNKKYQLMSDCRMVMPPTEIKCVDGKAVLVNGSITTSEVQ